MAHNHGTSPLEQGYVSAGGDSHFLPPGYHIQVARPMFPVTFQQYLAGRDANTRGTANPSVMEKPFWKFQIGPEGQSAWNARRFYEPGEDPWRVPRDPVWCFRRSRATRTMLPDGRIVCIGGESCNPSNTDYCVYNDVVVFEPPPRRNRPGDPPPVLTTDSITIYGYPVDIFPPRRFHTSTYTADPTTGRPSMIIIGGVGYSSTLSNVIYRLDLTDFSMQQLDASGVGPISRTLDHTAEMIYEPIINITTTEGRVYKLRVRDMRWI